MPLRDTNAPDHWPAKYPLVFVSVSAQFKGIAGYGTCGNRYFSIAVPAHRSAVNAVPTDPERVEVDQLLTMTVAR